MPGRWREEAGCGSDLEARCQVSLRECRGIQRWRREARLLLGAAGRMVCVASKLGCWGGTEVDLRDSSEVAFSAQRQGEIAGWGPAPWGPASWLHPLSHQPYWDKQTPPSLRVLESSQSRFGAGQKQVTDFPSLRPEGLLEMACVLVFKLGSMEPLCLSGTQKGAAAAL